MEFLKEIALTFNALIIHKLEPYHCSNWQLQISLRHSPKARFKDITYEQLEELVYANHHSLF
jgi:hypothetical protein